jgi:ribokinase
MMNTCAAFSRVGLPMIAEAYAIRLPVVLNLAPALPLLHDVLKKVSVLILNESEASLLSGQRVEK